ncbi:hypothetical protein TBLA_0H02110 [Henningerozyma blattae CBS 6284]|uniref:Mitochondrial import inner membrane translocase subunit n=1 Tax=Henningerozyma blattae (strain ATCC 34711 / CBS 6284 / DSM 70876 / NBRC 10599 / NRRL Y-10934 / UCD 77-7) TaxID=1071380 RepID=I2H7Z5_HENB6|nr:hypothetical protein TBLA_0H02110 [Tetrapisispora blattae CBS 6284]CCH62497.1 hypothetical protein TBLA_0H02110 [Tetrapisispora blattae CBS 6284]
MGISSWFGSKSEGTSTQSNTISSNPISDQLKAQISEELAIVNATELVNKATENCFELCMNKPYTDKNELCVDQCLKKYMQSWNSISKAYLDRIQQASAAGEI